MYSLGGVATIILVVEVIVIETFYFRIEKPTTSNKEELMLKRNVFFMACLTAEPAFGPYHPSYVTFS